MELNKLELRKPSVDLTDLAIGVIILGIVVSIGANIMLNLRDDQYTLAAGCNTTSGNYTLCNDAWQVADGAATGLLEYGNWFDIIIIVGVAGVILSLIFMAFGRASEGAV